MKKIIILLLLLNFNFTNSFSMEADVFVQSTVNRAAETLGGGLTKEERMDELKKIALDTVDIRGIGFYSLGSVSYTHLRAHETGAYLVCRLLLEKKNK